MIHEVFVWVPTKGWKRVIRTTKQNMAIETALQFVPLEVKLTSRSGPDRVAREWVSGQCHIALEGTGELHQIEALKESLTVPVV